MDIQADIKWIISEIAKVKDPELISALKSLLKQRTKEVYIENSYEIPDSILQSLEKAKEQAQNGELKPHSEVMKKYEKWL